MSRVRIQAVDSGAIWSTADVSSGIWRKEWSGINPTPRLAGYVATNFFPFTARKHKGRFTVLV